MIRMGLWGMLYFRKASKTRGTEPISSDTVAANGSPLE